MTSSSTFIQETFSNYIAIDTVAALNMIKAGLGDKFKTLKTKTCPSKAEMQSLGFTAKEIQIMEGIDSFFRSRLIECNTTEKITGSHDAFRILYPMMANKEQEQFWILLLNRANKVIGMELIGIGSSTGCVVDTRIVAKKAIEHNANSVILSHNHPSGNNRPSDADISMTKRVKEALSHLEISVLDHIIVANENYYSFADEGRI